MTKLLIIHRPFPVTYSQAPSLPVGYTRPDCRARAPGGLMNSQAEGQVLNWETPSSPPGRSEPTSGRRVSRARGVGTISPDCAMCPAWRMRLPRSPANASSRVNLIAQSKGWS
eukprot:1832181-Prymnesium_polylepis.1